MQILHLSEQKLDDISYFEGLEGSLVTPLIQSLANFAANHELFPFPSIHCACSPQRTAEVMDVSTEEGEGINYILPYLDLPVTWC